MALNWKTVTGDHVRAACAQLRASGKKTKQSGIVVWDGDTRLPAKEVLKIAYRHANGLNDSVALKFSSGDASIALLNRLGFRAERVSG